MKKLCISFVLTALMLAFAACGGSGNEDDYQPDTAAQDLYQPVAQPPPYEIGEIIQFGGREWRVLDIEGSYALLLHETVIAPRQYHNDGEDVTWETSSLRAWLNGEFFDSFSETDKTRIRETYVINDNNPWTWFRWGLDGRTPGGENTMDRIFILSIDEVVRYFGDSGKLATAATGAGEQSRDERLARTDLGIHVFGIHDVYSAARVAYNDAGEASMWWLRTPGDLPFRAANILTDGSLGVNGISTRSSVGPRPALWLGPEKN